MERWGLKNDALDKESRVELEESFRANHSALSAEDKNLLNWVKKEGEKTYYYLRHYYTAAGIHGI